MRDRDKNKQNKRPLKVFTVVGFTGHCPVGTSAVIVARDRGHARRLLVMTHPLAVDDDGLTFVEIDATMAAAHVLCDGDY